MNATDRLNDEEQRVTSALEAVRGLPPRRLLQLVEETAIAGERFGGHERDVFTRIRRAIWRYLAGSTTPVDDPPRTNGGRS